MAREARIDRPSILAAALRIADERGLAAVTMQAVAGQVGVTPMALYRHVAGKADLLDGLVEALLTEIPAPAPELPWEERLTATATGVRAVARRHPGVFPLLLSRPAVTPAAVRVRDAVHAALREAGLPESAVGRAERLLSTAVLGFAVSEAAGRFAHHDQAVVDEDFAALLRWLRGIVAPLAPGAASPAV